MLHTVKRQDVRPLMVLGYGNPGWQDDGAGVWVAEELEKEPRKYVDYDADFQLYLEHAADLARHEKVIFIDASLIDPEPFSIKKLTAAPHLPSALTYTSHYLSPEALLAICREHFSCTPAAWLVGVRIYGLDITGTMTDRPAGMRNRPGSMFLLYWMNGKRNMKGSRIYFLICCLSFKCIM
jgi:hydrogenase maturation protease